MPRNDIGLAVSYYADHPSPSIQTLYLGQRMDRRTLEPVAELGGLPSRWLAPEEVARTDARLLADRRIVGFGPRAGG